MERKYCLLSFSLSTLANFLRLRHFHIYQLLVFTYVVCISQGSVLEKVWVYLILLEVALCTARKHMCVCNIRVVLLNCMRLLPGALMKNACHLGLIWKICACLSKFIDRFSRWLLYRYILLLGKLYYLVLWLLSFISVPFCTDSQASFVFVFTFMFNRVQLEGHLEA